MLRPATPLTVLLFGAFVLLLISVLSTPIIKQIPLATFDGVDFGVFGYCTSTGCSDIEIGYTTSSPINDASESSSFDLPAATRTTLSAILIVHPIAAFFTLVMFILAAAAHFHSPSHSPRYLLGVFILSILTLVVSLLAFLIDVLLFVPHMAWGSYLVLAATILIAASGIVSCAMRRTLVSRKARKRRIAENAEMNGENFYNRQATDPIAPMPTDVTTLNTNDKAAFASFEMTKTDTSRTSDERVPLTNRTPTDVSPINGPVAPVPGVGMNDRYGLPPGGPQRDQYGNPMPRPPPGNYGNRSRDPSADPSLNRQYSDTSMGRGRGGMPPGGYRGRGGFPPNGRGGYGPPRGGYGPPRGGYGPPPRGGYGGPYRGGMGDPMMAGAAGMAPGAMMRGGRGAPPSYGAPPNGRGYDNRGLSPAGSYGRRPSPPDQPGYGNEAYGPPAQANNYTAYTPGDDRSSLPRAESPPPLPGFEPEGPVGQAIEMDATTGSPSHSPRGFGQFGNVRESDGDVAGMVGLQQQRLQRQTVDSETSRYSSEQSYVPPRQAWGEGGRSSPLASPPAELPSNPSPAGRRRVNSGDNYYEDVDPRFADEGTGPAPPAGMVPGYSRNNVNNNNLRPLQPVGNLDGNSSYEDLQSGARSPAESERSNFTSVSQRGVNPRWNGGPGNYGPPMPTNRRPVNGPNPNDLLLNSNPDFELQLPGGRGRGPPRGGMRGREQIPGMVPSSAYPGDGGL